MLRSDLCDYDAHIVAKGKITATGTNNTKRKNKNQTKNNVPFKSWTKINNTLIDNVLYLDIDIPGIYPSSFTNIRFLTKTEFSNVLFQKKTISKLL